VDILFHNCYRSLRQCDNGPVLLRLDTTCHIVDSIVAFPVASESLRLRVMHVTFYTTSSATFKSTFHSIAYDSDLYPFLSSDFTIFLCLLYRNLFVHAIHIHQIPQEDPRSRVYLTFLLIKRNTVLRHDFFAIVAALGAKRLALRNNFQRRLHSAESQLGQIALIYSMRRSLPARFSLPWRFILKHITSILMYRRPSASPLIFGSGDVQHPQAHSSCERVLAYGGGRQHEFSALDVEPYITVGNFNYDCAFKFIDYVDSLGQGAYPIAQDFIYTDIPLRNILPYLSVQVALKIARLHHLQIGSHVPKSEICRAFEDHNCIDCQCNRYFTVFAAMDSKSTRRSITYKASTSTKQSDNRVILDQPLVDAAVGYLKPTTQPSRGHGKCKPDPEKKNPLAAAWARVHPM
jgi:hypothetical protein